MKVQSFFLVFCGLLALISVVSAGDPTPPSPPGTYWDGAGDTPGMGEYNQLGQYLRFWNFPVKIYLNHSPHDARWSAAFENASEQLRSIVPLERTNNWGDADVIILIMGPQFFPMVTPCAGDDVEGCGLLHPVGRPGEANFTVIGRVWLLADTDFPVQHLLLHEIIHALGLLVHSPYPDDVMYNGPAAVTVLSERDIATLTYLYQQPAWGE